jgi:hypothetical protein
VPWTSSGVDRNLLEKLDAAWMMYKEVDLEEVSGATKLKMTVNDDSVVFEPIGANGQRMFFVDDKKGDGKNILAVGAFMKTLHESDKANGTALFQEFKKFKAIQDIQNLYSDGYPEKYGALQDAGLVGTNHNVMGGFFVVDETQMGDDKVAYARKAAGTTIRLMLGMLSCTVGNGAVQNKATEDTENQLVTVVGALKARVGAVKDMTTSLDVSTAINTMIDQIKTNVERPAFTDLYLFDHVNASGSNGLPTDFISQQIEALKIADVNAMVFLRAFNAITSFLMTAQNETDRGDKGGLNMLTTAADIVWQFQKVRRMVQIEALKQTLKDDDGKQMDSTSHLTDNNNMPLGSGSYPPGGVRSGVSRMFLNRMFETYVM